MTASAMIRKHIRPLLADHPDLEIVGSLLMLKPIHHVLRGIFVSSCDHDRYFVSHWAMTHFCEPVGWFPADWGERILRPSPGLRLWSDPKESKLFVHQLERDVLTALRSVRTLDDLVEQIQTATPVPFRSTKIDELRGLSLHAARGDLVTARRNLDDLRSGRSWWCQSPWERHVASVVDVLGPLLDADDRPGIARQLTAWEEMRMAKLPKGMAKIWQRTPFPVENLAVPHSS